MFKAPSWSDVCVPSLVVNYLKTTMLSSMDHVIHQYIFRNRRRPKRNYYCHNCECQWRTERSSDEVAGCPACQSTHITSTVVLQYMKGMTPYTKTTHYIPSIILAVTALYEVYFENQPEQILDVGWNADGVPYAQFTGGELVLDHSPKNCIIRAALLIPFLWDHSFDWNFKRTSDNVHGDAFSPFMHSLAAGLRQRTVRV